MLIEELNVVKLILFDSNGFAAWSTDLANLDITKPKLAPCFSRFRVPVMYNPRSQERSLYETLRGRSRNVREMAARGSIRERSSWRFCIMV